MSGARDLHEWTAAQVWCALTAAMRTDPRALDRLAEAASGSLDPHSAFFLQHARTLTLATSAALTGVLTIHRYGRHPDDRPVCAACGIGRCRTVRGVSDVLAAYRLRESGAWTLWPACDTDTLTSRYHEYRRGML
ncbi:hypothetical protein E1281_13095 [Actinomadura sp. KC345]|uniref:hypothetical protein n=1 Tax=Actinomadura sp. KC345 TaxID=2530371 RepID=UPI001053081E|nr:hypothetical protein [Actinomadura sp. KC345]TDC55317.1 hypothetical protein E1281_13095 [Actinomadura sp. KC345]